MFGGDGTGTAAWGSLVVVERLATPIDGERSATPEWFGELYRAHWAGMVRLAFVMIDDLAVAEDLAQDAFARTYQARATVRDPLAYVRSAVYNACRNHVRHQKVRRTASALLAGSSAAGGAVAAGGGAAAGGHITTGGRAAAGADVANGDTAAGDHVIDVIRRLPYAKRSLVVLRYYAQLTDAEIAAVTGLPVGTVKSRLHRTLTELRKEWS